MMVYPHAKFHCDRSTNNEDTGGIPPPPNLKMSKKPSPIRVNRIFKWNIYSDLDFDTSTTQIRQNLLEICQSKQGDRFLDFHRP